MKWLEYCGVAAPKFVTCQVIDDGPCVVKPRYVAVPGRPGAVLLGGDLRLKQIGVRLYMDARTGQDAAGLRDARHALNAWLAHPDGGRLMLPTEPAMAYEDAVLTGAGTWDAFRDEGAIELWFTCFDPIAYGASHSSSETEGQVGGSWETWPRFSIIAEAGEAVEVGSKMAARHVRLERKFLGGEGVTIDCGAAFCTVGGVDASKAVALDSAFFSLSPPIYSIAVTGARSWSMEWVERWA